MKIKLHEIRIQEIVEYSKHLKECQGYVDSNEKGVYGMKGRLNIRPEYQREFIYKDKQRDAVIHSIQNDFPLNVLYWVKNKDGSYEVLDGQQRLISIGQYVSGNFSVGNMFFHNLKEEQQNQILNYELMVYFCEGDDREKLNWFQTINIAGEKLSDQELRNAIYHGPWVSDARRHFSRRGCSAYQMAGHLLKGNVIRQDYLETTIKWISSGHIDEYMSKHQHNDNAESLWKYFVDVVEWTEDLFPRKNYRKEMKGVEFGLLYNDYKDNEYDPNKIEEEINNLMQDEDVTKKSGIYQYMFTRNEKYLSIRIFTDNQKREVYEKQGGVCAHCKKYFDIEKMEADHVTPWTKGGKTVSENCQMLCLECNRIKGAK